MKTRIKTLKHILEGKKVLHVGFADYPDYQKKIDRGVFLHFHLMEVCDVWGIDTHNLSVEQFKRKGVSNITSDFNSLPGDFDYILFGEILEHVNDPVALLSSYKKKYPNAKVIATIPNAFRLRSFFDALLGRELVNPDHRCWYSPITISKVFELAGYSGRTDMIESYPRLPHIYLILTMFPLLRDTVMITA